MNDGDAARAILHPIDDNYPHLSDSVDRLDWDELRGADVSNSATALVEIANAVWGHRSFHYGHMGVLDSSNRALVLSVMQRHLGVSNQEMDAAWRSTEG